MFGMMKNLLKEKESAPEAVKLSDLHVGCTVGFGFMPQKSISGRRLTVTEVNSYLFDGDNFVAFRLESENTEVNLIIADDGQAEGSYLALSRRLKDRFFAPLFVSPLPDAWFDLPVGHEIDVAARVLGAPQGWLATNYIVAMKTKGRILEGDFRMRKPAGRLSLSQPFDYVLLVDQDNTHALEAERYEDGTLKVFATIYRPVTDIGEIALPPRQSRTLPLLSEKEAYAKFAATTEASPELMAEIQSPKLIVPEIPPITKIEARTEPMLEPKLEPRPELKFQTPPVERIVPGTTLPPRPALDTTKQAFVLQVPPAQPVAAVSSPVPPQEEKISQPVQSKAVVTDMTPPVHGKFGRIQPVIQENTMSANMLACDTRLAGRIIDEAQRNQMPLSELIRKVIDLPARINEEVYIPFNLELVEYAELARRYGLQPNDQQAVRERIMEEMRLFVGDKRK
jgi:hypothetical protein